MSTSQGSRSSPHGSSPFPTFGEPQSAVRGQSSTSLQGAYRRQPLQTASTTSFHQRRSPPLSAQIIQGQIHLATTPLHHPTGPDDRTGPPPSPIGADNRQSILHQMTPQQDYSRSQSVLQHRVYQTTTGLDVPHPARPRFRSLHSFHLTPELITEIGLPHSMSQGLSGVAYAGGALSGAVSGTAPLKPSSLPNESTLQCVRGKRLSLGQLGETPARVQSHHTNLSDQSRESMALPCRDSLMREPPQRMPVQQPSPTLGVSANSPRYLPSLSDSCDPPVSHKPCDRDLRSVSTTVPLPSTPGPRQNTLSTEPSRSTPHSAAQIPDKSFPIQEESSAASSGPVAASVPPNPHSYITAPSPSLFIAGMSHEMGKKPVIPSYGPEQSVDSTYPNPFEHIRRRSNAGSDNETMGNPQIDPNSAREQLALQMQIFALKNGGMVSDSTLSPSSTPFPGPQYNPFTFLHTCSAFNGKRSRIANEQASTRSSPSHEPVPLPSPGRGYRGRRRPGHSQDLDRQPKTRPPPRVESTQPRDTSSELLSGEETSVESTIGECQSEPPQPACRDESTDDSDDAETDDGRWVDEDLEVECGINCLVHLGDAKKRRRRWKLRWEALLRDFHALDRETDTTFVLLAAPFHTGKLHSVASRSVRRDSSLKPTEMKQIRSAFAEIVSRQHAARTPSLLEQFSRGCLSSYDGPSSSGSGTREEDLRRALETAIGSLYTLGDIYERRETRWAEEKLRLDEDNDRVQLLLKQVLSPSVFGNLTSTA